MRVSLRFCYWVFFWGVLNYDHFAAALTASSDTRLLISTQAAQRARGIPARLLGCSSRTAWDLIGAQFDNRRPV